MHKTARSALGLLLCMLFALSSVVQPQAEPRLFRPSGCIPPQACGPLQPHQLTLGGATAALAASASRLGLDVVRLAHRGSTSSAVRGGVDLLFCARNQLLLARAQVCLVEHLSVFAAIHAATQGTASAPSRAPPALS